MGGHSVEWLQKEITEQIREYVPDAIVTVMVIQINSIKIFVVGKVARPGEYRVGEKIDVMQALALAGGLSPFADEGGILIIRKVKEGQIKFSTYYKFHYDQVKNGKKIEQNIGLQSGDVVVVP